MNQQNAQGKKTGALIGASVFLAVMVILLIFSVFFFVSARSANRAALTELNSLQEEHAEASSQIENLTNQQEDLTLQLQSIEAEAEARQWCAGIVGVTPDDPLALSSEVLLMSTPVYEKVKEICPQEAAAAMIASDVAATLWDAARFEDCSQDESSLVIQTSGTLSYELPRDIPGGVEFPRATVWVVVDAKAAGGEVLATGRFSVSNLEPGKTVPWSGEMVAPIETQTCSMKSTVWWPEIQ